MRAVGFDKRRRSEEQATNWPTAVCALLLLLSVFWLLAVPRSGVVAAEEIDRRSEHPLMPVLRMARDRLSKFEREVHDYECRLVKREFVDGRLSDHHHLVMKIRHESIRDGQLVTPFSVYSRFESPAELRGREAVYVEGRFDGKVIGRRGGRRFGYITLAVDPESEMGMLHNRYPITEAGIANLLKRLLEVGTEELRHEECEVDYFAGARIDGRDCTVIQVTHPVRRDYFLYHIARIFVDDALQLPIRYASYDWPEEPGGEPPLLEEYTYLDLKFNAGFSDWDFDYRNEAYGFRKNFEP